MDKKWISKSLPNKQIVRELSKAININETLSSILVQRGVTTFDDARDFFRPSLEELHDPLLMHDMHEAVERLTKAFSDQEKILVYGDYDVDGTTSVAMMYTFLKKYIKEIDYYIPDRFKEGYGISDQGVQYAIDNNFTLIIALDCGIRSVDKVKLAKENGVDFIICDHHNPGDEIPDAKAVLDPKKENCQYPYKELSGCGVGFKLIQAFASQQCIEDDEVYDFLDLLVISIASDIVPITGENRILAYHGLQKIKDSPRLGIATMIELSGIKNSIDIGNLVFSIGPRINAAGRLGSAKDSVNVLIANDEETSQNFASIINKRNEDRRGHDRSITEEVITTISESHELTNANSTVMFNEKWHKGVVGIVASRCIETYFRPTIILTESNGKATGSARSIPGFNLYDSLKECEHLLDQWGGHMHAAGLTLSKDKVELFKKEFERVVTKNITQEMMVPVIDIDQEINLCEINYKMVNILKQFEPMGPGNMQPVFMTKKVKLRYEPRLLKEEHIKLSIYQNDSPIFDCIGFNMKEKFEILNKENQFDICYTIEENRFKGNISIQLRLKDLKVSE